MVVGLDVNYWILYNLLIHLCPTAGLRNAQVSIQVSEETTDLEILLETATRLGVNLTDDPIDVKIYIVAFFKKLLLQREKLDHGLLIDSLEPAVERMWREVLKCLEDRKRKLLDVQSGSMTFTLFCPTKQATIQLQDVAWIHTLNQKIKQLLKAIGIYFMSIITQDHPQSHNGKTFIANLTSVV